MFDLIDNKEIKEKCYNYIFSLCDNISFLYFDYKNNLNFEQAITFSKYKNIVKDILKSASGNDSWNMSGIIYTFKLSDDVKNLIIENSLNGIIELTNSAHLENLTLYKNNNVLYSVCSHEGYERFDSEFANLVNQFCIKEIKNTTIYKELFTKYTNLQCEKDKIIKNLTILNDLKSYIQQDWQAVFYINPKYECKFNVYVDLAKQYLSKEFLHLIKNCNSFKEIFPSGFPITMKDCEHFKYTSFENTEIHKKLTDEVNIWNVILLQNYTEI